MNADDFEDKDPDEAPEEKSFRESADKEFQGKPLEPFSFLRQTAARALGLRYGNLSPEEVLRVPNPKFAALIAARETLEAMDKRKKKAPAAQREKLQKIIEGLADEPEELNSYDGVLYDAILVLWLCSQPDSVCMRARRKPREYEREIDRWAENIGLSIGAPQTEAALQLFSDIVTELQASKGEPKLKEGEKESPN